MADAGGGDRAGAGAGAGAGAREGAGAGAGAGKIGERFGDTGAVDVGPDGCVFAGEGDMASS